MEKNGPLGVVGASVLWRTAGTAGMLISADSVALAAARLVIGGTVPALFAGRGIRKAITPGLLLAAVAVAAYQLCFFAAVARTGVAIVTVVAIGSGPVFTGLLPWLFHGERLLLALLGGLLHAFYAVSAARSIGGGTPSGAVTGVLFGGAGVGLLVGTGLC